MKALVLSDGAGTRSRPCMLPSATSSRALPRLIDGKVRTAS